MALSNFSNISSAIEDWLNRSGFTAISDKAEDFLLMSQRRVMREVRIPPMESVSTPTFDSDGKSTVPSDYLEAKYLIVDNGTSAWALTPAPLPEVLKRQTSSVYSQPTVFDVEGGSFYVGAKPASGEVFTLVYYKELQFISSGVSTNWFSTYAPELLLFGALTEAAFYMKDFEAASIYEQKFSQAKQLLMDQKNKGEHAGSPLSVRSS